MIQTGDRDIFEIKLGDDFLMTSLFHEAEEQLSKISLQLLKGDQLEVVVGGLGLGYTALAALDDERVSNLLVIDFLGEVIEWHRRGLVPLGDRLTNDKRCQFVNADFFSLSQQTEIGFDLENPNRKFDAVLLDIDHTPTNVLDPTNSRFYTIEGLTELSKHIKPNGVFGLWTDGNPDAEFTDRLKTVFGESEGHLIEFPNSLTGGTSFGTVYTAIKSV